MINSSQPSRFPRIGPYSGALDASEVIRLIDTFHGGQRGSQHALQMLVTLMHHAGYIDPNMLDCISHHGCVPLADLRALCSFYTFLDQPTPCRYRILVSTNIIDEQQGAQETLALLRDRFHDQPDIVIKPTSCTGFSDLAPGALINGIPVTGFTRARAAAVADLIDQGIPFSRWPADFFHCQSVIYQQDALLALTLSPGDALRSAQQSSPAGFIETLKTSGLRGRGGAGFPTWQKWATAADTPAIRKHVVCNADEGEPGTFKDRVLLEHRTDAVIEGMRLCGWAIGATQGHLYLRGEYVWLHDHLQAELSRYRQAGVLGPDFDISIHVGAGAYVCGEESALLESMEGKRGIPRIRPPFPAQKGYLGEPTVVNNVETFCAVSWIALNSAEAFARLGNDSSRGTKLHSVAGDCDKPGIYELPMGTTVSTVLGLCGASNTQAVQVGGPSGRLLFPHEFDTAIDFAHVSSGGSFMVFSTQRDLLDILCNFAHFFAHESCGFCTPCRAGTQVIARTLEQLRKQPSPPNAVRDLQELSQLLRVTSHCGLGQTATSALNDVMLHAPMRFAELTQPKNPASGVFARGTSQ